ncbi:effector-associated constant component EACC1 [Nocardia sp. CDC160]|uniref:effector-associated constant component EACC1 n=1 Tax=Nocardia sp. CDC160 TaxID=3112166 RepID=UPI002DB69083|nr:hypothetical protein [Nocardia sp. CDC160]MEC3915834.1 hypothetical protein [Nocardia sp. CDC160]
MDSLRHSGTAAHTDRGARSPRRGGMDQRWQIEVGKGTDSLRIERMTRSLNDAIADIAGVRVEFVEHAVVAEPGSKGGVADFGMWISLSSTAAPVLIAAIKEWCGRDRHRRVELSRKGDSTTVTITGDLTDAQERVIDHFLGAPPGPAIDGENGELP